MRASVAERPNCRFAPRADERPPKKLQRRTFYKSFVNVRNLRHAPLIQCSVVFPAKKENPKEQSMVKTIRTLFVVALALAAGLSARGNAETGHRAGAVFVMTNAAEKNQVIAFKRNADGSLTEQAAFPTGGRGSGGVTDPLGSQGSLTLTQNLSFLLAVNAGSGDISVFQVNGAKLLLVDRVPCGGSEPVAVAQRGDLVYVLNAGGASNVTGFRLEPNGKLKQIPDSTTFLSTTNSGAASLAFSPDGEFLLVTEKLTNNIDAFHVQIDDTLGPIVINPSGSPGTFSVSFAPNGTVLLTSTGPAGGTNASTISSYSLAPNGQLTAISLNVPTEGAATCWQATTPNGQFVFTDNSGSANIAGFSIGTNGALTPLSGTIAGILPTGSANLDVAITPNGKFLYTLDSGTGTVGIFAIGADGTLTSLGDAGGLSEAAGFNGIAAF